MIPLAVLAILLDIFCCYHVVKTGRDNYWLYLILIFQPMGAVIYFAAIIVPDLMAGHGRRLGKAAIKVLDPKRAYREAQQLVEESPTVDNRMGLAAAAIEIGQFDEAAHIYATCLDGIHADDPVLLQKYATCLVELERYPEALSILQKLGEQGDSGRTPQAALLLGRTHEGLGHVEDADRSYAWAAERLTGVEGLARYVLFLVKHGQIGLAEDQMAVLEKRVGRTPKAYLAEAAKWRDAAAAALKASHG